MSHINFMTAGQLLAARALIENINDYSSYGPMKQYAENRHGDSIEAMDVSASFFNLTGALAHIGRDHVSIKVRYLLDKQMGSPLTTISHHKRALAILDALIKAAL